MNIDTTRGIPMDFDQFNIVTNIVSPSTIHCSNNTLVLYLERYLLQRVMSVFKFELPDEISERYFKYVLFINGWIILTKDAEFGCVAHYGSLKGTNLYYEPKSCTINFQDTDATMNREINRTLVGPKTDAVLMILQENYSGIMDMVSFYAERMALIFEAFDMNIINSHLAYVFGTDKKAIAETFKKIYDEISGGSPVVVTDKDLFDEDGKPRWTAFFNNLKQNYIGGDLMLDLAKVRKDFDTEIGIPSSNTEKRERVNTQEVNSNSYETITRVEMWLQNMQACFEKISKIYPEWKDASVSLRVPDTDEIDMRLIGGMVNGQQQTDSNRTV